jgi:flagellar biosynthesis repressor protein FlbT
VLIHLKRNERLFVNGAVLRLDRRGTIELMNNAQFLLENHIMQAEAATTPLRQLYFIVQTMILDPENARLTVMLFQSQAAQIESCASTQTYLSLLASIREHVAQQGYFDALKLLRKSFALEDELLGQTKTNETEKVAAA